MPKYRKKPVVIEALRFGGKNYKEIIEFTKGAAQYLPVHLGPAVMKVATLEGDMRVSVGDFVIRGVSGEFYPCKPDIFNLTYERVEEQL